MRTHKVVSRNFRDTYTVWFEGTRKECKEWIIGRYGHFPPFAAICLINRTNYDNLF